MIKLDHDGRYKTVITFDDKSYVLQPYEGDIVVKGNTLKSRSNEKFLLDFVGHSIAEILLGNIDKVREEYDYWTMLIEMKQMSVEDIIKRQNINQSLEEYNTKVAAGQNRLGQYEVAISADRNYQKGDTIYTWIEEPEPVIKTFKTKPDKEVIPNTAAYKLVRLEKEYNGNIYRKNYLDKLKNNTKKFLVVMGLEKYKELFPEITITKDDKAKLINLWGLWTFVGKFPNFDFRQKDYDKMSREDQLSFQQMVYDKILNQKYKEYYTNGTA